MALSEAVARTLIHGAGKLPVRIQRWIGGKPLVRDGYEMFPEVQMGLKLLSMLPGSDFETLPLDQSRAQMDAEGRIFGAYVPVARIEDSTIPGRSGNIPVRIYDNGDPRGIIVYYHGGGWVVGGVESNDRLARFLAVHTHMMVVVVDYRLAPEHPFPAGLEDALDAFRWVRDHAAELGAPAKVMVAGDSAGANFSAVISQLTRDDPEGGPLLQVMYCPVTDLSTKHDSYRTFSEGFFLTEAQMDWYKAHYLGGDDELALDPRVSPLLAEDVTGVAPAHVVVSGFDPLRDEGLAYGRKLAEAGVPTRVQVVTGHVHAFLNTTGVGRAGVAAFEESCAAIVDYWNNSVA